MRCRRFDLITTDAFSNAPEDPSCTSLVRQRKFKRRSRPKQPLDNVGLQTGDLVCFNPILNKNCVEVESVSISGIWREGIRRLWDSDSGSVDLLDDKERRPMNRSRERVTMAEMLFGWVDDVSQENDPTGVANASAYVAAYKGRVRISDAVSETSLKDAQLSNTQFLDGVWPKGVRGYYPLKILASPKPPCPEFYLTDKTNPGDLMIRNAFPNRSADTVKIQGTKFYWVHTETIGKDDAFWATGNEADHLHQKCFVRPIKSEIAFTFHIDFENLTETELQLLCYVLHPTKGFYHRCGLGKPLGLGAVLIEPGEIEFIDRRSRYASQIGLLSSSTRFKAHAGVSLDVSAWADAFSNEPDQHSIVTQAGQPVEGVKYPNVGDSEEKNYDWFVKNRCYHNKKRNTLSPHSGEEVGKANNVLKSLTAQDNAPTRLPVDPVAKD